VNPTVVIDADERELLLEAFDKHPAAIVVERRKGEPDARHVAGLKLRKKGLLTWKSVEASAGAESAYMRTEYTLTDPAARTSNAN